ncbi:MAG: extracellular solute-binding protein [Spirochaetia bacterium]|jgi:iron(III) transport system substrate-binding protein|nr:extracellular solute-binding protein [Spirochaetia bacterium]
MKHTGWKFLLVLSAMVLVGSALFAEGVEEVNEPDEKITAYISGPSAMLQELEQAFEKDRGDVLDIVGLGCGPLRQRVWTEFKTGGIRADVFWGSDPLLYIALDEAGALDPYVPQGIEQLKPIYRTKGNYTLVNERYGVILYNTDLMPADQVPTSFADLTKPEYDHAVLQADPEQSSTALALVATLYDMKGRNWDYYKSLVNNHLYLAKKNSAVPSKIMEKEFLLGIAPDDEALRLQKKARKGGYPSSIGIVWPSEGALAIERPIAISNNPERSQKKEQLARAFEDFMISKEAQEITLKYEFISVRSDLSLPAGIPDNFSVHRVDWKYLSEHQDEIKTQFNALF